MENIVNAAFGGKLRIRVCGVFIKNNEILLVEHKGLNESGSFWIPPGGGVNFGETLENALIREFSEETGLEIKVKKFLFGFQFIEKNLHAIELFFQVDYVKGVLVKGIDPELKKNNQIIKNVRFVTLEELKVMNDNKKHKVLRNISDLDHLLAKTGFID